MKPSAVCVTVYSPNASAVASRLSAAEIEAYGFDCRGRELRFWVRKKDAQKTFAILDELCYNYSAGKRTRAAAAAVSAVKRLGLIIGTVVFAACLAFLNGYVWRIQVSGNDEVATKVILNELAANGCKTGVKRKSFDGERLGEALESVDGIKLAYVTLVGTTVKVEVHESDKVTPPIAYYDTPILSRYDATVTKIVLREGTAAVKCGDNVFKGDPLIHPYRTAGEEQAACRASGTVYGRVVFTKSVTVATEWYEQVAVKTYTNTYLKLFGLNIGRKKLPPDCKVQSQSNKLNLFVPVTAVSRTITEVSRVKMTASAEELAERELTKAKSEFIHGSIVSGISGSYTLLQLGGGLWQVNLFIQAEAVIGG